MELPAEFECAAPFGAEMLVVYARTKNFDKLETVQLEGYEFLKETNLAAAVAQARGMKRKEQDSTVQQTEVRVTINTVGKQK